jgi:hypothetical protein
LRLESRGYHHVANSEVLLMAPEPGAVWKRRRVEAVAGLCPEPEIRYTLGSL